jgi:organic anion transporter 4A
LVIQVHLRCVEEELRSFGLGLASFLSRILGATVAPICVGVLMDQACALWQTQCNGDRGSCYEYHNGQMGTALCILALCIKGVSTIAYGIGWRYFPAERDEPYAVANGHQSGEVHELEDRDETTEA